MANRKKIKGKAVYQDFEDGFWGIESDNGNKYTPINMPEQLKINGAEVVIQAEILQDAFSLSMWGEAIRIVGFETLNID
jgi:hypothetical protein